MNITVLATEEAGVPSFGMAMVPACVEEEVRKQVATGEGWSSVQPPGVLSHFGAVHVMVPLHQRTHLDPQLSKMKCEERRLTARRAKRTMRYWIFVQ